MVIKNRSVLSAVIGVMVVCLTMAGCSYAQAEKVVNVVGSVIAVAQADLPTLEATGIIPLPDQIAVNAILALLSSLDKQTAQCLTAAQAAGGVKSAFAACFQVFATNLAQSPELAALHILSAPAQGQVKIWLAAVQTAVFSIIIAFGGVVPATFQASAVDAAAYSAFESKVKADHKAHPHRVM